jgi:cellobiose transport system permease protein
MLFLLIVVFGVLNFLISRRIASTEARLHRRRTARRLARSRAGAAPTSTDSQPDAASAEGARALAAASEENIR